MAPCSNRLQSTGPMGSENDTAGANIFLGQTMVPLPARLHAQRFILGGTGSWLWFSGEVLDWG